MKQKEVYKMNEIKNEKQALIVIASNLNTINQTLLEILNALNRIEHEIEY